ncbi:penicillin-binding protein 2 [Rhizomicrobium electricum]|uniref:Penicillin-binding protein 2 n=1 Tax=Rhizomicrobium electricum TaxID=480070 RepID=A0ABN1EGM7_9PROT|nr:penicillin-binding protein 2 [Rhizomicrobium electricum]NIJ48571.1 penicillin-binding protein 2 [Rhizomicrobium electricum]
MPLFDRKDKSRYASFTRRTLMLSGAMGGIFAVLGGRLYQLQILNGKEYMVDAENNRISQRFIFPPRGRILDRFGTELATNRRNYRVVIVQEQASQGVETAIDSVAKIIQLDPDRKAKVLHDISVNKKFAQVPIAENLSWEEFARINMHLPYLPGVQTDVGETRAYPYGAEMSHLLGYVAAANQKDVEKENDPLLAQPGFRLGKGGIEKQFDTEMRGEAGASRVEVNAYGRVIRELSAVPSAAGKDVWLTIDCDLQRYAEERLAEESAACVVMDVETGDVLALVSTPGFDPNLFNVGITNNTWQDLLHNDHKPLMNKVLRGAYPPGSTFKTAMALAAMENGLADLQVHCSGSMTLGNHEFHCWAWKKGGHGGVDLHRGIAVSCDIFFYEVARRLGIDKMEATARALGLGEPTGIEMPGEVGGCMPGAAWKLARFGVPWQQGDSLSAGIGQGYVLATPLQLCQMVARIASGKAVTPRLVHQVGPVLQPRVLPGDLPFSQESLDAVRLGMQAVCEPGGTAFAWRIAEPGFEMAGKTGTAQVRVITKAERQSGVKSNSQVAWSLRDNGLFVGFAPVVNPRYACACIVEHNSDPHPQVAATRDILLFAQKRDPLRRPTAYPIRAAENPPPREG